MKMAVIGCGLIGGSMALSWKRAGIVDEVIAFGHNPATLQKALDKGAADTVTTSMEEAVKDADIVVSAVPVEAMESVFTEMAPFLKSDAVVTDDDFFVKKIGRRIIHARHFAAGNGMCRGLLMKLIAG